MTPPDPERVETLFHEARQIDAAERDAFLRSVCPEEGLLQEVSSLLAAWSRTSETFLETAQTTTDWMGKRIASFALQGILGSGGMGVVYDALQDQPRRRVALKVLRALPGLERDLERLRVEAEIMGALTHENIAQVYEAGTVEEAGGTVAWFAMERIDAARGLAHFATEEALDLEARLALFDQVCRGVQHGHGRGVLHRDLKPDNVLVRPGGQVKIIDFGIARAAGQASDRTALTRVGDLVGTLGYMSPEQCRGDSADVRSDVFSLGVILYELTTGKRPFDLSGLTTARALEVRRQNIFAPPEVDRELATILNTTLAGDAERRYQTVAALREDLRRYRAHEPILARPPGALRDLALWARRHRILVAVSAALLAVLLTATAVSLNFGLEADRARIESDRRAYVSSLTAASAALRNNDGGSAIQQLDQTDESLRGFEWHHLRHRADMSELRLPWAGIRISGGAMNAKGTVLGAYGSGADAFRVWDTESSKATLTIPRSTGLVTACAIAPDGSRAVLGYAHGPGELRALPSGRKIASLEGHDTIASRRGIRAAAFASHGRQIATGDASGTIRIHDAAGKVVCEIQDAHSGSVSVLTFLRDDREILSTGAGDQTFRRFDAQSGARIAVHPGPPGAINDIALAPDGTVFATAGMDRAIRLWDAATFESRAVLRGHEQAVMSVAFSPDGESLGSGSLDDTIRFWRTTDGYESLCCLGHASDVRCVAFAADDRLWSLSRFAARRWNPKQPQTVPELRGLKRMVADIRFRDDEVLGAAGDGSVAAFSDEDGTRLRVLPPAAARPTLKVNSRIAALNRSGSHLLTVPYRSPLTISDTESGEVVREIGQKIRDTSRLVRWSLDEQKVIWLGVRLSITPVAKGVDREPHVFEFTSPHVGTTLAQHPDRNTILVGSSKGRIWRHDLRQAITERVWQYPDRGAVCDLEFAPDGAHIAVAKHTGEIEVRTYPELRLLRTLRGHAEPPTALAYAPDGARLASSSPDGTVRIWEPQWGVELLALRGHSIYVFTLRWNDEGSVLATGGGDGGIDACTIRLWKGSR